MHDIGNQNIYTRQTEQNHGYHSIAAQVQRDKTAQMQRENVQEQQFWDNHNKAVQQAWAPKPSQSTPTTTYMGGEANMSGVFPAIMLVAGFMAVVGFMAWVVSLT